MTFVTIFFIFIVSSSCRSFDIDQGRPRPSCDQTKLNRVFADAKDDRDRRGRSFGRKRSNSAAGRGDNSHLAADEIGHERDRKHGWTLVWDGRNPAEVDWISATERVNIGSRRMSQFKTLLASILGTVILAAAAANAQPAPSPPPTTPYGVPIGLEAAKKVMAAAETEAMKNNWPMAIVILDSTAIR
jgi:hypothetical protein